MSNLTALATEVAARPEVASAKVWNDRRVYVNFVGFDGSKAGDRNAKCYYDAKAGWVIDGLKGTMSSEFNRSIRAFAADHCRSAFWAQ